MNWNLKSLLAAVLGAAALTFAAASPAAADYRCVALAYNALGKRINGTRAVAERVIERRACRAALRRCERRLDGVRFDRGRRLPFARCEVRRVTFLGGGRRDFGGYCNYRACERRYRSFRASDCTFKPFEGPRRLCRL